MASSVVGFARLRDAIRIDSDEVPMLAREMGSGAAHDGAGLDEVIDHVERAFGGRVPTLDVIRSAAVGWAESALVHYAGVSCEDPLTSLATVPHIRTRLNDLYRLAERDGSWPGERHALVVVELPAVRRRNELETSLQALDVATVMRTVYAGDETIARMSPVRFAALVDLERADPPHLQLLTLMLDRALETSAPPRMWVEQLPQSADAVPWMLAGLSA